MKTKTWPIAFVLSVSLLLTTGVRAEEKVAPAGPAAVVNGTEITEEALASKIQEAIQRMSRQQPGFVPTVEMLPKLREDILTQMIEEELLYQEAQARKVKLPETRVTDELTAIKKQFTSEEDYREKLAAANLSEEDLVRRITRIMLIRQLIDEEIVKGIDISAEESRAFYDQNASMFQKPEQVRARHILIKVEADATDAQKAEALKKIEAVRAKALAGEDFAALAKVHSEGPSGAQGGDLGSFSRGQMVKPFEDVAFSLEPGKISEVVETQFGYHIILVTEHQPTSVVSYEEAQAQIEERLTQEKINRAAQQFIASLREKADIQRN